MIHLIALPSAFVPERREAILEVSFVEVPSFGIQRGEGERNLPG